MPDAEPPSRFRLFFLREILIANVGMIAGLVAANAGGLYRRTRVRSSATSCDWMGSTTSASSKMGSVAVVCTSRFEEIDGKSARST